MNQKLKKVMTLCIAVIFTMTFGIIALAASSSTDSADDTVVNSEENTQKKSTGRDSGNKGNIRGKNEIKVSVTKVAASVLGITEEEVKESIKTGKVGDLLISTGKVDDFKSAYLSEAKTKLDSAVASGTLTQEQADEKYAAEAEKMATYDGTTHLCGGSDHSKMFEKKDRAEDKKNKDANSTEDGSTL